jgi:hypothetical protein
MGTPKIVARLSLVAMMKGRLISCFLKEIAAENYLASVYFFNLFSFHSSPTHWALTVLASPFIFSNFL